MEAVGTILAVVPILVSACKGFQSVLTAFKRYKSFTSKTRVFHQELSTLSTIYKNETHLLLGGGIDYEDACAMLNDSDHPNWTDEAVHNRINENLGDRQTSCANTLQMINEKLEAINNIAIGFIEAIDNESKKPELDLKTWKRDKMTKIKFSFSKSGLRNELNELRTLIQDLQTLVNQNSRLRNAIERSKKTRISKSLSSSELSRYQLIGEVSDTLYDMLNGACTLHLSHAAHLNLEPNTYGMEDNRVHFQLAIRQPKLKNTTTETEPMWLSVESHLNPLTSAKQHLDINAQNKRTRENLLIDEEDRSGDQCNSDASTSSASACTLSKDQTRVKSVRFERAGNPNLILSDLSASSSLAASNLVTSKIVALTRNKPELVDLSKDRNLCHHIRRCLQMEQEASSCCIGYLKKIPGAEHLLYVEAPKSVSSNSLLPLSRILSSLRGDKAVSKHFSLLERIRCSRLLATAILQFHATSWLNNNRWRSKDIYIRGGMLNQSERPIIESMYIEAPMYYHTEEPENQACPISERSFIRDPLLFSLALIMIELAFQTPLQDMYNTVDYIMGRSDPYVEYSAAVRRSQLLSSVMPLTYKNIVLKCLHANFNFINELGRPGWSTPAFREEFYGEVVCELKRLEDEYQKFQLL